MCEPLVTITHEGLSQDPAVMESEEYSSRKEEPLRIEGGERQGQHGHQGVSAQDEREGTEEAPLQPGCIHSSHQVMETQHYVFCALCGKYGKQLRRSQLRTVCPRGPRDRFAGIARDKLMVGEEPVGRTWALVSGPAVNYVAD